MILDQKFDLKNLLLTRKIFYIKSERFCRDYKNTKLLKLKDLIRKASIFENQSNFD